MKFLSLFAGIGGFDLGLERAGMECVGQVEIEPFCQKVLAKHWPNVWRWNDVKTLTDELVKTHCGTVDLLCGGVPCQPASVAGKRLGAADHRWLWPDFLRLVSEVNPVWMLAENPRGVLSLDVEGMQFSQWIANEFTARGYELLPVKLAAEDVGAPHRRERIFFVGYSKHARWDAAKIAQCLDSGSDGHKAGAEKFGQSARPGDSQNKSVDDTASQQNRRLQFGELAANIGAAGDKLADALNARLEERWPSGVNGAASRRQSAAIAGSGYQWPARPGQPQYKWEQPRTVELPMGGAVAGLSERLARRHRVSALKALGNAIVPQVAEVIGRAIMQMEKGER